MRITNLLLWVQENKLSEKFYKKLGFEIKTSDDTHSVVSLSGFDITLVNMRDEDKFSKDSMSVDKGRGMYIYIKDSINVTIKVINMHDAYFYPFLLIKPPGKLCLSFSIIAGRILPGLELFLDRIQLF